MMLHSPDCSGTSAGRRCSDPSRLSRLIHLFPDTQLGTRAFVFLSLRMEVAPMFAFFGLGVTEIVVVLVVAVFLFGNQLPGVMRWLGQSVSEFKKEAASLTDDFRSQSK